MSTRAQNEVALPLFVLLSEPPLALLTKPCLLCVTLLHAARHCSHTTVTTDNVVLTDSIIVEA